MRHWLSALKARSGDVLGMNRRNLELVYPLNPRWAFKIADDKLLAKRTLTEAGVTVSPTLLVVRTFSEVRELAPRLRELDEFVIKPAHGRAGRGILVIAGREGDRRWRTAGGRVLDEEQILRHVADVVFGVHSLDRADQALFEPRLIPSPFFAELAPTGLSDVRIICREGTPVASMIRAPTVQSEGRANIHQGAVGIAVDLESGELTRAWHKKTAITHHPDTGLPIVGQVLPDWPEMVRLATRVAQVLPLGYLGLDIIVDRTVGPLVLEFNARPGLEIQNVNGFGLRGRLRAATQTSTTVPERATSERVVTGRAP